MYTQYILEYATWNKQMSECFTMETALNREGLFLQYFLSYIHSKKYVSQYVSEIANFSQHLSEAM